MCYKIGHVYLLLTGIFCILLGARDMSGIVAHNLSGLRRRQEVTYETDRMAQETRKMRFEEAVWKMDGT